MNNRKSLLVGAALAGLFAGGTVALTSAWAADTGTCAQNNTCKGKGACGSVDGKNACAGKNSCKNHVFKGTKEQCDKAKGTFTAAAAPAKK